MDNKRVEQHANDYRLLADCGGATQNPNPSVLLLEDLSATRQTSSRAGKLLTLAVPDAPSALHRVPGDALLQFVPLESGDADPSLPFFESVQAVSRRELLMMTPPGSSIRLNGLPAPIAAPLALADEIALDAGLTLHVSRFHRATAMAPPPSLVGKICSVCMVPFSTETRVLLCAHCGESLHLEGEEIPSDRRLECARLGACPTCHNDLPEEDGLVYWPKDDS